MEPARYYGASNRPFARSREFLDLVGSAALTIAPPSR
jgi:hypothetical protein